MMDFTDEQMAQLGKLFSDFHGPHDDAATAKGVELGMMLADTHRKSEFRQVFEAGYRAGYEAASAPAASMKEGE